MEKTVKILINFFFLIKIFFKWIINNCLVSISLYISLALLFVFRNYAQKNLTLIQRKPIAFSIHLDTEVCASTFSFFFFFWGEGGRSVFFKLYVTPVGPMHCSRDPQTSFFSNFFIKNEFYGIIHTFKNYFATVFSVFSSQQYPNRSLVYF